MPEIKTENITANIDHFKNIGDQYLHIFLQYLNEIWPKILGALLVLWIGFKIINFINKIIERSLVKAKIDPLIQDFSLSLTAIILKILVFLSAAGMLGVQTTSFIALFTAAGVAIGMSLSGTLQNFAGGMIILAFKLYKIGDYVSIGDEQGTVKSIHIFHTILTDLDRKTIIIPNAKISDGTMINFSTETVRRQDIPVGVGYETDTDFARKVFTEILEKDERVLKNEDYPIKIFVSDLGDSAVKMTLRFFVASGDVLQTKWDITENILKECGKNNISIPFPQRDIHLYKQ